MFLVSVLVVFYRPSTRHYVPRICTRVVSRHYVPRPVSISSSTRVIHAIRCAHA
jgi:hypothetical protein